MSKTAIVFVWTFGQQALNDGITDLLMAVIADKEVTSDHSEPAIH